MQPDVTKVGGISEERRIAWMAEENGVQFIPHGWNTALGLASDLQLASASRKTDMVEYLMGSPFIDDLVETPWCLDAEGMLCIPDGPGLGVALNGRRRRTARDGKERPVAGRGESAQRNLRERVAGLSGFIAIGRGSSFGRVDRSS